MTAPLPQKRNGGFTLLEMIITLVIFVLLIGAVFGLLTGVLQGTSSLQEGQNRRESLTALQAYLNSQLTSLPARDTIASYLRGSGDGLTQNGVIYGNARTASVVDAKVQPNGYFTLRSANYSVDTTLNPLPDARQVLSDLVTSDDPTVIWTTLITDLKTLDWKFQDFNATDWVEIWTSGTKPNLIEFDVQAAADIQPQAMDFWVPPIQAPSMGTARQRTPSP